MAKRIFWLLFIMELCVIAILGLVACRIEIPLTRFVIERCPQTVVHPSTAAASETDNLIGELQSLRTALALAPSCEAPLLPEPLPELPPTIELPPDIKKSEEITFILDTSGSMRTGSLPSGSSPQDVALPLLQNAFSAIAQSQPMSLWRYDDCDTNPVRVVGPGNSDISRELRGLSFNNSSAAARAILNIPAMIPAGVGQSADRPMNVILISDGSDQCSGSDAPAEIRNRPDVQAQGGRICLAARRVARKLPHLAIHVVALDESLKTAMACVKDATDGWFIESDDPEALRVVVEYISNGGSQGPSK